MKHSRVPCHQYARFIALATWVGTFVAAAPRAWAVSGDTFDYHGYMRAGSGSNFNGGDQTCYNSQGIPGNQFRLGNECGIYGEAYFQAYAVGARNKDGEFFRANFDVSYNPGGQNLAEPPNFDVFGAYIEAGRFSNLPETFWVGKRYYRDTDIHIDDFFYFADVSGDGAGIQDIPFANGKLAFAIMREDDPNTVNGITVPVNSSTASEHARTLLFDARLLQMRLDDHDQLNLWAGYALSGDGKDTTTGQAFDSAHGYVAGAKEQYQSDAGSNRITAIYGRGLMQGMNLSGTFGADPVQILGEPYRNDAQRWRFIDEFVFQTSRSFATAFAAIYETWNLDPAFGWGRWASAAARPIYFFSDHFSVAFEAGAASVKQSAPGSPASSPLVRFTLAPQISPTADFFSRPVLRAFVTDTTSVQEGASYGFQGEVWF